MGRRVDGCRFRLNFNGHPSSAHRSPGMSARSWRLEAEAFNARASEAIRTAILEVPISDEETGISGRLIDFEDETAVAYGESKVADEGDIVPFEVGGMVELYAENSKAEVPRTEQLPCVCRGELLVSTGEPHAEALDCSIRVRSVEVVLREKLARP